MSGISNDILRLSNLYLGIRPSYEESQKWLKNHTIISQNEEGEIELKLNAESQKNLESLNRARCNYEMWKNKK